VYVCVYVCVLVIARACCLGYSLTRAHELQGRASFCSPLCLTQCVRRAGSLCHHRLGPGQVLHCLYPHWHPRFVPPRHDRKRGLRCHDDRHFSQQVTSPFSSSSSYAFTCIHLIHPLDSSSLPSFFLHVGKRIQAGFLCCKLALENLVLPFVPWVWAVLGEAAGHFLGEFATGSGWITRK
jgi:hypothetical protein